MTLGNMSIELSSERGQAQNAFGQTETLAKADALADAEGEIGIFVRARIRWQKAFRNEMIWVLPIGPMAM